MAENVNEWARTLGGTIRCACCGVSMPQKEELRRLNATERLSAEDAHMLYHAAPQRSDEDWRRKDALFAYAEILEGKDE